MESMATLGVVVGDQARHRLRLVVEEVPPGDHRPQKVQDGSGRFSG